ncbi:MAG: hydroxymethylglutaryl-CoA reductase, degradative [Silvanigrellaceae bacterium]|nr:hydroxymethylglutaryl-CoA reductase, degradative [Silvanigrellaceae bacterium]
MLSEAEKRRYSIKKEANHGNQCSMDTKTNPLNSSRIPGFAQMNASGRLSALLSRAIISPEALDILQNTGALPLELADKFIENCIGGFTLPLGISTNFLIDGEEYLVPMAVEESSVIAAASYGAKLARSAGGFFSEPTETIATGQVQFFYHGDKDIFHVFETSIKPLIYRIVEDNHQKLIVRGGGVKSLELRTLPKNLAPTAYSNRTPLETIYVIHIHVDTREAMGANIVNTIAEEVGKQLPTLLECRVGTRILTNLTLHRITKVRCEIELSSLEKEGFSGLEAAQRIVSVWEFAELDPFRAATHNKGIMNGIDPVVIATGNDWRAVEAGCHAFAALTGRYKPLTKWFINTQNRLQGEIELPIAVGTVGGVTKLHPSAKACLQLLGNPCSARLSAIIASTGLAQNLSAIRALACEGIQRGHMALHEKNLEIMKHYDHFPALSMVDPTFKP